MKKKFFTTFFLLIYVNYGFSQNDQIKSLVEKTNYLNLNMWELTDYAKMHIKDKNELAKFFYYWVGSNIEYDNELFEKILAKNITIQEFLEKQNELIDARISGIRSQERSEEIYAQALSAMRTYSGHPDRNPYEEQ